MTTLSAHSQSVSADAGTHKVSVADEKQREKVIGTLVMAFADDPIARWMYPEPQQYLSAFPAFIEGFGGGAFAHDAAHCTSGFRGAALWLPPGVHSDQEALEDLLPRTVAKEQLEDLYGLLEQMDHYHPDEPHWYLPLLGVEPRSQGCGLGSALLAHALEICDREDLPAYLEATGERNAALYTRHGFEPIGEIQAGRSPALYPMLRKPQSRAEGDFTP